MQGLDLMTLLANRVGRSEGRSLLLKDDGLLHGWLSWAFLGHSLGDTAALPVVRSRRQPVERPRQQQDLHLLAAPQVSWEAHHPQSGPGVTTALERV